MSRNSSPFWVKNKRLSKISAWFCRRWSNLTSPTNSRDESQKALSIVISSKRSSQKQTSSQINFRITLSSSSRHYCLESWRASLMICAMKWLQLHRILTLISRVQQKESNPLLTMQTRRKLRTCSQTSRRFRIATSTQSLRHSQLTKPSTARNQLKNKKLLRNSPLETSEKSTVKHLKIPRPTRNIWAR